MITEKQKENRKNYIGSSEVASIISVNPYESAYDIWLEKTGKLEAKPETEDMQLGHQFESVAINLAEQAIGTMGLLPEFIIESAHLISHPDAILDKSGEPVEAKESGIRNPYWVKEHWGEANSDQVPDWVIAQAQVHILATKKSICHIPTILGGRGFVMFFVPEDKDIQQLILDAVGHFWDEHVIKDIPPKNVMPSIQTIKRIRREPQSSIEIARELVEERESMNNLLKKAQKDFEIADIALKTALGTAEVGYFDGGQVTYFQYHKNAERKIREGYNYRCLRVKRDKS